MNSASNSSTEPTAASYGFHCTIEGKDFGAAVVRVIEALKAEGFGVLKASLVAPTTTPN